MGAGIEIGELLAVEVTGSLCFCTLSVRGREGEELLGRYVSLSS